MESKKKTYNFVYQHGNFSDERLPVCTLEEAQKFRINFDADKKIVLRGNENTVRTVQLYFIKPVTLPEWMTPEFFISNYRKLSIIWSQGFKRFTNTERFHSQLIALDETKLMTTLKVLKENPSNEFMRSLRLNLEDWLNNEKNIFAEPFTEKMWNRILPGPHRK